MSKPTPEQIDRRILTKRRFEDAKAQLNEIDRQIMEHGPGRYFGTIGGVEVYLLDSGQGLRIRYIEGF